jgi:aspartate aminotransferase
MLNIIMINFYKNLKDENFFELIKENLIQERKDNKEKLYNMSLGVDQFPILPEIINEISKNLKDKNFYKPNGPKEVRNYLLTSFKEEYDYKPTKVLFGTGIKQLLFTFLQTFNGEVIFLTPCWSSYLEQCKLLKKKYHLFEREYEDNYKINYDRFQEWVFRLRRNNPNKQYTLIFNNPCNPTGMVHSEHDVLQLAAVCKRNNILVFEDYIYAGMEHDVKRTTSISEYYPNSTIRVNSISKKYGLGGYRLAWCFFPKQLDYIYKNMFKIAWDTYSVPATPMIKTLKFIKTNKNVRYNKLSRKFFYKTIGKLCYDSIKKNTNILVTRPEAAWYLFLDFRKYSNKLKRIGIKNSEDLCLRLIKDTGIITIPGTSFSSDKLTLRFSYVNILNKNISNMAQFSIINTMTLNLAPNIFTSITLLSDWLNK